VDVHIHANQKILNIIKILQHYTSYCYICTFIKMEEEY
jgi:hypothetical protein